MNQGALDRARFEAIEAYVMGTMPSGARARFEQEMAADPVLRAEVELQRENTLAIELGGLDRVLKEVAGEQVSMVNKGSSGWKHYLKYAAAVALLLGGALWFLSRPSANERLFAEHFTPDPGLPVPMSISGDPVFHDAMVAYKLGDYAEARNKWGPLLQAQPSNDTLRYYIASAALADDDPAAAIPLLQAVADDATSHFHAKAQWYLFLAHLRAGDRAGLSSVDLDDDPTYGERVRAIKSRSKP